MDRSKFDDSIKKIIHDKEFEVPFEVKHKVSQTLSNLPKRNKRPSFTRPLKYLLSGAVSILLPIGVIYYLTNENILSLNESQHAGEERGKEEDVVIHDYLFTGESEHWQATYEFFGKGIFSKTENGNLDYESESESLFYLEYKGDLTEIEGKPITYRFETNTGAGDGSLDEIHQKSFSHHSGPNGGTAMMQESEPVEVTVEWDGKQDSFQLYSDGTRNWRITPTFPPPSDDGHYSNLRGLKGKAVYIDTGEMKAGEAYKTRWFFWGDDLTESPGEQLKITATQKDTGRREIITRSNGWEISNPQYKDLKEVLNAQASQHVMMTLPSPGFWRLDAHIGNKYYASIVIEVKK
ncbi:hypothetical protein F7731_10990 [Cytobacillus depressus]|uniref:DUF4871 domain-containing protein n=1 Tax=Cytobacillus depressus TaxID=1602942 RepID=A0A6L3V6R9_9BACI|nr:hypothetical protein [Cytobacillus depressus]KAB2336036.1 hypothetical protein F7731_10990 [Cytobacillus depressus]